MACAVCVGLPPARHGASRPTLCHRDLVPETIFTIGHSNVTANELFARLAAHDITQLADVRAHPGSRRHPQFGRDALAATCAERGIGYRWMPELGGRRRGSGDTSPHQAWQVPAFRAYADYGDTPEFASALGTLEGFARTAPTAFLCAEALWWQCHRRIIADHLLVRGWDVRHVLPTHAAELHHLPDFARSDGERLVYDVGATPSLL
jgi:uncharacterized protein (DUF488 family)